MSPVGTANEPRHAYKTAFCAKESRSGEDMLSRSSATFYAHWYARGTVLTVRVGVQACSRSWCYSWLGQVWLFKVPNVMFWSARPLILHEKLAAVKAHTRIPVLALPTHCRPLTLQILSWVRISVNMSSVSCHIRTITKQSTTSS